MHFLSAVSLVLVFSALSSRAAPVPQNTYPVDQYVPLNTYEAFESPPPEDTLLGLATDLNVKSADLYALSVFYTYDTLPAAEKEALTAQRELNKTIDDEVNLCMWTFFGDCRPLWINGHRRELGLGWGSIRKQGEKDYDARMKYVGQGEEVAAGWARMVQGKEREWKTARNNPIVSDRCSNAGEVWNNDTSHCEPSPSWAKLKPRRMGKALKET